MVIKNKRSRLKKAVTTGSVILAACVTGATVILSNRTAAPQKEGEFFGKTRLTKDDFDKNQYSRSDPASIWVIVNKQRPLNPVGYVPADLVEAQASTVSQKMAPSLNSMVAFAAARNVNLRIISGYRSHDDQKKLYDSYVAKDGQTVADTYAARPGHSEHQTGLAVDIGGASGCELELCFGDTAEGKWLAQNAYKYGFIIRYTSSNRATTGYDPEPWHLRYVGAELAREMKKRNVSSLEQFFNAGDGNNQLP